jgi:hypothetical protein
MNQVTYKELFEKYARREQQRNIVSIASGAVAIVIGVLYLRQLRADRQAMHQTVAGRRA